MASFEHLIPNLLKYGGRHNGGSDDMSWNMYTSYQMHLPIMYTLCPENRKCNPQFLNGKIILSQ